MLGLKASPLESSLPNSSRRRIWAYPELSSHSVLVLTFDRLYLTPLTGAPKSDHLAAIDDGADLDVLLGPLSTVIDLVAVQNLVLDLLTNSLTVDYASSGVGRSRLRLRFATPETADACFTKLWRRLGEGYQLARYKRDAWHTVRAPLALLGLILFVTAVLVGLHSIHQDRAATLAHPTHVGADETAPAVAAPKAGWETWMDGLNWKLVCGAGGVAAAVTQVWLYRRLTAPPLALELVRC